MRYIDADALKKELDNIKQTEYAVKDKMPLFEYVELPDLIKVIDNAPPAKPQKIVIIPTELIDKLASCVVDTIGNIDWDKAIEAYKARPQGEWIYGEDECGQDGWFCSECGFFVPWYYEFYENDIDFIREYKACPHCLAEMVTYTGKDRDMRGGRA